MWCQNINRKENYLQVTIVRCFCLSVCVFLSVGVSLYVVCSVFVSVCLSHVCVFLSVCLSHMCVFLSVCVCLSVSLSVRG